MICKVKKCVMIVVLFASLSCKKEGNGSDLTFSPNCNFSGSEVEVLDRLKGTLSYTNNISGLPGGVYKFVIKSPSLLQMVVCNMPVEFEMEKGASKNVTFSGRMVVLPDEVDATNTDIELNYLKSQ